MLDSCKRSGRDLVAHSRWFGSIAIDTTAVTASLAVRVPRRSIGGTVLHVTMLSKVKVSC